MAPPRRQILKNESPSDSVTLGSKATTPSHILYDLNIFAEWSQDIENANRPTKETTASGWAGKLYSTAHRSVWTFLRSVGVETRTTSPCNLPVSLVKLLNVKLSWGICLSPDGEYLAVLQETSVEVRSRRDNYASAIGKAKVREDADLQWRRMAWSDDSQLLSVSYSTGAVTVLDIMCGEFFTLNQPTVAVSVGDLSSSIASIIFSRPPKGTDEKWDFSLTIINHQGLLTCYLLSTEEGVYEWSHQFQFSSMYPQGVSSAIYSEKHSLLVVTGLASPSTDLLRTKAGQEGITAWRVLSGNPYYKRVTDYEQDSESGGGQGFLKKFTSAMYGAIYGDDGMQELVLKSCLSPDGKHLLTLSTESKLCLYQMPSLTLVHSWSSDHQPCGDQLSPSLSESPKKTKYLREHPHYYKLLDIAWWSNEEIILARYSGAVLVADIENLSNLLGEFPEWFDVCPQIQQAHDGGFLSLECESRVLSGSRKRTHSEGATPAEESGSDDDDDESSSLLGRSNRICREALFYITDMDRFEPPKKKTRRIKKTYKLVSLKSTTPDELFARKIDHEEYGEALALAKMYHLDSDLVYQRQWRKSNVTLATIHDYLSKIRKRSWVLHECLERVPSNIDAMRELLQYGLRGTELDALVKIGQGRDKGRFIVSKEVQLDESFDEYDEESAEELEKLKKQHQQNLLDKIDFENLTLEQKELCRVRLKLLTYLDRLATYEEILGGGRFAEEHFDAKFFQRFRSQNVIEAITDYAQAGDPKAVDTMFIYLGEHTLPHSLAIMSNFPETLAPVEFAELLPAVEGGEVVDYPQESLRELDWCEHTLRRKWFESGNPHSAEFLYEENEGLRPFCEQTLTPQLLTDWYKIRACDIEETSRLVDHALQFVDLGVSNGIENLRSLGDDLSVMEMIVYDCNYGDSLTFKQLQEMDDLQRLKTIMSKSSPEKYALHIQKWMKRFLEKCEAKKTGSQQSILFQYLVDLAADDLQLVFKVFECSKADQPASVRLLSTEERLLKAAIDCIYSCERDDQLSFVLSILECLPNRKSGSMERSLVKLHNDVDELEVLITAAEILETYGVTMTISSIRDSQNDVDAATLLMRKLTRRANNRTPSLTTAEWTQLQSDMSVLQSRVYRCIDKYTCCEIFVESLLCSGKKESIELALVYMDGDMESSTHSMTSSTGSLLDSQISYEQGIDIVVRAAREYFNSSGSHADHNMQLAEFCLHLFHTPHHKIKQELDLIQALPLLTGFGISLIPLRVRLCENKLELIKEALQYSTTVYKQYPKLLKLADGLRVNECAVLQLIVREALAQNDNKFAYKHCKNLINKQYPDIWSECYQLALSAHFTDIDARMSLLSYSLVHCTDDMIEEVLAKRMALKTEILVSRMHSTAKKRKSSVSKPDTDVSEVDGSSQSKSDWQTLFSAEAAVGALSKTTQHTKSLLSNLGDMKWIDKTVSLISGRTRDTDADTEMNFGVQGCHPFYEDIIAGCRCSIELGGKKRLEMSFPEDVLRTKKLEESLTKGTGGREDCSEVLVNCAIHALPVDVTLGLGFLLAVSQPEKADSCFKELPHVPLTLRLGAYYYALQLLSSLSMSIYGNVSETITLAQEVPQHMLMDETNKVLFEKLDLYVRLMEDHSQACYLQSLGKDVDSHRFTADNDYKRQTILSLTRSADQIHYDTAISMAKRYSVSFWDVYMTHLQYLLVESGLTTTQVDKRIDRLNMTKELLSEPAKFADSMKRDVLPFIEGTDMSKLQLYYKLVDDCPSSDFVSVDTHRKLLSKLIPAAPGLDYGALMEGAEDPVAILRPVLKSGNVHVFSKLSGKIPIAGGDYLSSSAVFNAWAQKLFTDGASANSKVPESTAAWVHRYESCGEYMGKMEACDNIDFLGHALFSEQSLERVSLEARQEICRRNVKHCKANAGKDTSTRMTWAEALETTQQFQKHLERMGDEALIGLRLAEDKQVQSYHRKIDACMSQPNKLKEVLVNMLLDGQALELVHDILQVLPVQGWTVRDALNDAILVICTHLRERKKTLKSNNTQTLSAFENLISQVGEHQKEGGDLVSSEDVMSLFRPLIPDTGIEMETRLLALNLLEQNFVLDEEDKLMVLLYQTQAITSTNWPDRLVERKDVHLEQARISLFTQLVDDSTRLEQFLTLPSLLSTWPPMKDVNSLWIGLIDALLSKIESSQGAENVVALCLTERLTQGVVQHAYSLLKANDYLRQAAMLALHSESPVLRDDVIGMMCEHSEMFAEDDGMLKAVFEHHLLVNFVDTELFKHLVDYLTLHQKEADFLEPNIVINELLQAKHTAEASVVDKACRGQQGLRTLGAAAGAISAISRWWRKD